MRTKSLFRSATATALAVWLLGCAQNLPLPERDLGHGWTLEQKVIKGLSRAQASADQRIAVFAIFDGVDPTLERLKLESARLRTMWLALDAKSPTFSDQSVGLIEQRVENYQNRLKIEANFDRAVAEVLDSEQWKIWKRFLAEDASRARANRDGAGDRRRPPPR